MSWEPGNQTVTKRFPNINEEILAIEGYLEEDEAKLYLYKFLRENPTFACELLTGVKLFPFQHMAIKTMMDVDYTLGIWSRGMSKSFSTAIFAILDSILNQGVHIGIISKTFRQSKMIFNKIEEIYTSTKSPLFAQCVTNVQKSTDAWVMTIGRSKITALPLGDGEKLRGFRFHRMIVDELLLMPEKIMNEVILPFLSVVDNPIERQQIHDLETQMIAEGKMTEEERKVWPNNKIIGLSSASYKFEYLYKLYQNYERMILADKDKQDGATRAIIHLSYDCAPQKLYDENLIKQARETMSQAQYDREFNAIFTDDSSGYFKVSRMAACTIPDGEGQSVEVVGEKGAEYILCIDPSWSESESSDDFAIHIIKRNKQTGKGTVVHSYGVSGTNLRPHIIYTAYILNHFNIVMTVADYNGGVQFINACNESSIFKDSKLKFHVIDADLDDPQEYQKGLLQLRRNYNPSIKQVFLRKPSSQWIRYGNELLQGAFDHKRILFAGAALDEDYTNQTRASIPIKDLKFMSNYDSLGGRNDERAIMVDFVEHIKNMIEATKVQCALIEVTTSPQGTQSFDLPLNLRKQRSADKARKDSYSALVLGNWMLSIFNDMLNVKDNTQTTFTPMFLK